MFEETDNMTFGPLLDLTVLRIAIVIKQKTYTLKEVLCQKDDCTSELMNAIKFEPSDILQNNLLDFQIIHLKLPFDTRKQQKS